VNRPDFLDSSLLRPVYGQHLPTAPRPDHVRDLTADEIRHQLDNLDPDED
jgi:hypothetical protein